MPDVPIESGSERDYPPDMEARVRVLEEIAVSTREILTEIRADQRALRTEMTAGASSLRAEMMAGASSLRAEMIAMDHRRERDFRITFGAIITTTLGLAYLIARTAHWL
jgi:hypothetical protein